MLAGIARGRDWLAGLARPWLGDHRPQYEPRQLTVPAWYLRARLPSPAPSISLVTPSLGQGRFISRAVTSVLAQGYPRLEYVIRDGGSTDDTLARLERFRPRLAAISSGPDGGQAAAINAGFAETAGEIMGWLNCDDILLPGSLAHVARWFARHPDVDVVYGDRVVIDEWDRDEGIQVLPSHRPGALRWANFVPQECTFWRRSAWGRCGPLDESLRFAMDWDLFRRLEAGGARFSHTRRLLGGMRRHRGQKTEFELGEALPDSYLSELELMYERWNGHSATVEEAHLRSQRYRLRAIPSRWPRRALDRLPYPRVPIYFPQ